MPHNATLTSLKFAQEAIAAKDETIKTKDEAMKKVEAAQDEAIKTKNELINNLKMQSMAMKTELLRLQGKLDVRWVRLSSRPY